MGRHYKGLGLAMAGAAVHGNVGGAGLPVGLQKGLSRSQRRPDQIDV